MIKIGHILHILSIVMGQGFNLIFLPPYSPELNPIEKFPPVRLEK